MRFLKWTMVVVLCAAVVVTAQDAKDKKKASPKPSAPHPHLELKKD